MQASQRVAALAVRERPRRRAARRSARRRGGGHGRAGTSAGPGARVRHAAALGHARLRSPARLPASRSPTSALHALVAVALYQLEHAKAPPFAVVDRAVDAAAPIARPRAKALVNAMLRRYLRERDALLERAAARHRSRAGRIRGGGSTRVLADWPEDWAGDPRGGQRAAAADAARATARDDTRGAAGRASPEHGIAARAGGRRGHRRRAPRPVTELPGYARRRVLGAGRRRAARGPAAATRATGMRVLDACAAPGGKTDASSGARRRRARRARRAMRRGSGASARTSRGCASTAPACAVMQGDAGAPAAWWDGLPFDRILADVPCTASGIVRRHPDGKWLRRPGDVASFAARQRAILDALWPLVKPGGELLYVTCSVFREENEARDRRLLLARIPTRCANPSPSRTARRIRAGNSCLRARRRATIRTASSSRGSASPDLPGRGCPPGCAPPSRRGKLA